MEGRIFFKFILIRVFSVDVDSLDIFLTPIDERAVAVAEVASNTVVVLA